MRPDLDSKMQKDLETNMCGSGLLVQTKCTLKNNKT